MIYCLFFLALKADEYKPYYPYKCQNSSSTKKFFTPPVSAAAKNSFQSIVPLPIGTCFLSASQSDKHGLKYNLPGYFLETVLTFISKLDHLRLELHFDQVAVQSPHDRVIDKLAVKHFKFTLMVVQPGSHAFTFDLFGDLI